MPRNVADSSSQRFPGTSVEYAVFFRKASQRDPNGWKLMGRPTTEHETLRSMVMPDNMVDSNLHGVTWVDEFSDVEYKLMERTVERSEWRTEHQTKRE